MTVLERKNLRRAMYSREALKTEDEEQGRSQHIIMFILAYFCGTFLHLCCQCVLFAFMIWIKWHHSKITCYTESLGLNDLRGQFTIMLSHLYLKTSSLPNSLLKVG